MFMDLIGIAVAFSAVMLLLSLLVTSLSQATQAFSRLRARNLAHGLSRLLEQELPGLSKQVTKAHAHRLLTAQKVDPLTTREKQADDAKSSLRWIEPETLGQVICDEQSCSTSKGPAGLKDLDSKRVVERFKELDGPLRARFGKMMRGVAIVWAIVVAVGLQVSTLNLLRDLSRDRAYREKILSEVSAIQERGQTVLTTLNQADAAQIAFTRLLEAHPEIATMLDDLEVDPDSPEAIWEDLADALEEAANREELVTEYEQLQDAALEEQLNIWSSQAETSLAQLSLINITPWRHDSEFYLGSDGVANAIGVVITAILLSLGAPFWFNVLTMFVAFRNVLSATGKNTGDAPPAQATPAAAPSSPKPSKDRDPAGGPSS